MALRLILLRHGDAAWPSEGMRDHDRPLTEAGGAQAQRIAQCLRDEGWAPDSILSSSAKRAHETAKLVAAAHDAPLSIEPALYDTNARGIQGDILAVTPVSCTTILLVGHNPTFSDLASTLAGIRVSLSTANAALMSIEETRWADAALMDAVWRLDKHLVPI